MAVKRKAKEPEKQAAVQQHQHPQEQIVSKAKTYDTDSIRQYMAKKRHLDKLKDRQNQEAERRRREEKEKRLEHCLLLSYLNDKGKNLIKVVYLG